MKLRLYLYSALSKPVAKLPDDPRPVPAGMSASVEISMFGPSIPVNFSASRTIGCLISATVFTRSMCE